MQLKDFQLETVKKSASNIYSLLLEAEKRARKGDTRSARFVLKSCTGSGKTVMLSEILRVLQAKPLTEKYVFMWAAPNKLHAQSYKKLKALLQDTEYSLIDIEELEAGELPPHAILFSNWEKMTQIAKKDDPAKEVSKGDFVNVVVCRGETRRNLQDVFDETRAAGYKTILIADESHKTLLTGNSQNFIDKVLQPVLTIEASATPKLKECKDDSSDTYRNINVDIQDVIDSGLIKKQIEINPDLKKAAEELNADAVRTVITAGLKKRDELEEAYDALGLKITPLMLVQLPTEGDGVSQLDHKMKKIVEEVLAEYQLEYYNNNLAVWLSDEKENLENITDNKHSVEVLIFKNAIALGWDCPRAQVLVILRDIKSKAFQIQTVGRILRMPEAKHYGDDLLDSAYVYTNYGSKIEMDKNDPDGPNLIKYLKSYRRAGFENICLPDSVYVHRTDYGDLRASVKEVLERHFNQEFSINDADTEQERYEKVDETLEVYPDELREPVITDVVIQNIEDIDEQQEIKTIPLVVNDENIEPIFQQILRGYCGKFKNFARSYAKIVGVLKPWFKKANIDWLFAQRIFVCSEKNQIVFARIFERALDEYDSINQKEMAKRRQRQEKYFDFEIPETDEFSEKYQEIFVHKNIMDPYYRLVNAPKGTEIPFEEALEKSDQVEWWYKNGEKMEKYFAVKYLEQADNAKTYGKAFYPDYIVRFTDGRVGIFDTKQGFTAEDDAVQQKANALQKYIKDHADLNVFGGIINVKNKCFYLNQSDNYNYGDGKTDQWQPFEL